MVADNVISRNSHLYGSAVKVVVQPGIKFQKRCFLLFTSQGDGEGGGGC